MGIWDELRGNGAKTEWAQHEIENLILYQVEVNFIIFSIFWSFLSDFKVPTFLLHYYLKVV